MVKYKILWTIFAPGVKGAALGPLAGPGQRLGGVSQGAKPPEAPGFSSF